ncbi:TetR/AcrR family transcriptional regulator, partial [Variovorax sp. CT11-76]
MWLHAHCLGTLITTPRDTPPISARRAATQARLADAAVAVFARKGVPGSTVEEICEEAGFTRGAFYS